jgi:hypothetical protein
MMTPIEGAQAACGMFNIWPNYSLCRTMRISVEDAEHTLIVRFFATLTDSQFEALQALGGDFHKNSAAQALGCKPKDVTTRQRTIAKNASFFRMYSSRRWMLESPKARALVTCATPNCKGSVERPLPCIYCEHCCYEQLGDEIEQRPLGGLRQALADAETVLRVAHGTEEHQASYAEAYGILSQAARIAMETAGTFRAYPTPVEGHVEYVVRLCVKCGKPVERERECYVSPTCYACLPPPEPLPIALNSRRYDPPLKNYMRWNGTAWIPEPVPIRRSTMAEGHSYAPWSDDQVASLNAYQEAGVMHPFTGERKPDGSETILIATQAGWVEELGGSVVQKWAHAWMANWAWKGERS